MKIALMHISGIQIRYVAWLMSPRRCLYIHLRRTKYCVCWPQMIDRRLVMATSSVKKINKRGKAATFDILVSIRVASYKQSTNLNSYNKATRDWLKTITYRSHGVASAGLIYDDTPKSTRRHVTHWPTKKAHAWEFWFPKLRSPVFQDFFIL